jgi:hypothetical protein
MTIASLPDCPLQTGRLQCKMVCLRVPPSSRQTSLDLPATPSKAPEDAPIHIEEFPPLPTSTAREKERKPSVTGSSGRRISGSKNGGTGLGKTHRSSFASVVAMERGIPQAAEGKPPIQSKRRAAIEASLSAGATGNRRRSSQSEAVTGPPVEDRRVSGSRSVSRRSSKSRLSVGDNRGLAELLPRLAKSHAIGAELNMESSAEEASLSSQNGATSALSSSGLVDIEEQKLVRKMERRASESHASPVGEEAKKPADPKLRSSLDSLQKHRQNPAIMKWVKERLRAREKNSLPGEALSEQEAMLKLAASRLIGNMEDLWELGPGPLKVGGII